MLPRRLGDRGPIFLDDILKGWLPGPWERHSCVGEEAFTSQRDRGRICNHKLFLINARRGGVFRNVSGLGRTHSRFLLRPRAFSF